MGPPAAYPLAATVTRPSVAKVEKPDYPLQLEKLGNKKKILTGRKSYGKFLFGFNQYFVGRKIDVKRETEFQTKWTPSAPSLFPIGLDLILRKERPTIPVFERYSTCFYAVEVVGYLLTGIPKYTHRPVF